MPLITHKGQRPTYGNQSSPSTVWVQRIKLSLSDLPASSFYLLSHLNGTSFRNIVLYPSFPTEVGRILYIVQLSEYPRFQV